MNTKSQILTSCDLSHDLLFITLLRYLQPYTQHWKWGSIPRFSFPVTDTSINPVQRPRSPGIILDCLVNLSLSYLIRTTFCQLFSHPSLKSTHLSLPLQPDRSKHHFLLGLAVILLTGLLPHPLRPLPFQYTFYVADQVISSQWKSDWDTLLLKTTK